MAAKRANRAELFRRLRFAVLLGLAVMVVLLLLNLRDPDALPSSYMEYRERPTACEADQPPESRQLTFDEIPDQGLEGEVTATLTTSCGDIVITLDPTTAPRSVSAFVHLAREGYYDGSVVAEIQPGLQLVAGDPNPTGPDRAYSAGIPDEFPPAGFTFRRGTVALAGDRASRSGGFLIVLEDDVPLSPRLNVIGQVTGGGEVIDQILDIDRTARTGAASRTIPSETIYLESVSIEN